MFKKAIVKIPSDNFDQGITTSGLGLPDHALALRQHAAYCEALQKCGLTLITLAPDPRFPDSTFVEDTAIVTPNVAIITRPGDKRRAGEEEEIEKVLNDYRKIEHIKSPGHIDGGDILQVESHFFIGISERSNKAGALQLQSILSEYGFTSQWVDTGKMLHLKSGVNYIGENRLLVREELSDSSYWKDFKIIKVSPEESYAANCVRINDFLLIPKGFPHIREKLLQEGITLIELEMSEFQKMDGGLSCLSIRF